LGFDGKSLIHPKTSRHRQPHFRPQQRIGQQRPPRPSPPMPMPTIRGRAWWWLTAK
jgi:hypothetical protein